MKSLNWKILFAGGFGAGMLLTALLKFPPNSSSDWATWVQAIGSVGAIGIAIWVSHKQYRDSQRLESERRKAEGAKEAGEVRAFVQATREELSAIWDGYNSQIGPALRQTRDGHPFLYLFPASAEAFTIYNGSASYQIGKVPDTELRRLTVSVYARAKGLIFSFQLNNSMVRERLELDLLEHSENRSLLLRDKDEQLSRYAKMLKERDSELKIQIEAFFNLADKWLLG